MGMTKHPRTGADYVLQDGRTVVRITSKVGAQIGWLEPATGITGTTPACIFCAVVTKVTAA